ncbi:MAG TPA: U32 family peptidase [Gemmatimonadaceae bacterium]
MIELLAPAGSLDAVRAAIANGANSVYLGVERFNARDEGAQLTFDELDQACAMARARGVRIYLTLNVLLKPAELQDALLLLGEAIDRGVSAVIAQDLGFIRLIQRVYPGFEIHGSTQMTVHDASGAQLARDLGIERVVMARENTLDDLRAVRAAVPELGLESFVHGALCISYSGQCLMSGMISERSANRGSCAQSCRKDYILRDDATGDTLDRGFLISAKDLAAHDILPDLADIGIQCVKIEGRKKKPEYVAIAVERYRDFIDTAARDERAPHTEAEVQPLVQIYSRGFTTGMYRGRGGRDYVTRLQPDNRGTELGTVVGFERGELVLEVSETVRVGDGLGFEPPPGVTAASVGFSVEEVRTVATRNGVVRQSIRARTRVPVGWRVVRSSQAALLERARATFASIEPAARARIRLDVRVAGVPGQPLRAVFTADGHEVAVQGSMPLTPAMAHALDDARLRDQFGRLGTTPFALGSVDRAALAERLFAPVSELNRLRQQAVDQLMVQRDWAESERLRVRAATVRAAVEEVTTSRPVASHAPSPVRLVAEVYRAEDAREAAAGGATEVVLDPFLRHPSPPASRVRALAAELAEQGVGLRLRTPTIVRPEDRPSLDKWLALDLPILTGHAGLACELAAAGRDVVADYAVNCFNQHTAAELLARGLREITASVELTIDELRELSAPWHGAGFGVLIYGRPEGMTVEHCVLSAAFDRQPTTCRDLCVKSHPVVTLTDPTGYSFPVATDSDCRNRLLHSRPIEGSEFIPRLMDMGIRSYRAVFNVPGEPIRDLIGAYRVALGIGGTAAVPRNPRQLVGQAFTRGHFVRPV